jgi:hypothetical protein
MDFDGVRDIVLATYNGEVLFFKDNVSRQWVQWVAGRVTGSAGKGLVYTSLGWG